MKHGYSGIGPGMAHGICRDMKKPSPLFEAGCPGFGVHVRCSLLQSLCSSFSVMTQKQLSVSFLIMIFLETDNIDNVPTLQLISR